jgi:hypothetical protein
MGHSHILSHKYIGIYRLHIMICLKIQVFVKQVVVLGKAHHNTISPFLNCMIKDLHHAISVEMVPKVNSVSELTLVTSKQRYILSKIIHFSDMNC